MSYVSCSRCGRPAPIDAADLQSDAGGDPSLLPVLVPPDGWIGDPNGDGIVCAGCAEPDEIVAWMADLALAERLMTTGSGDGE